MFYCYYQDIADKQIILILRINNIHLLIIMIILGTNFLYNNILLVKSIPWNQWKSSNKLSILMILFIFQQNWISSIKRTNKEFLPPSYSLCAYEKSS